MEVRFITPVPQRQHLRATHLRANTPSGELSRQNENVLIEQSRLPPSDLGYVGVNHPVNGLRLGTAIAESDFPTLSDAAGPAMSELQGNARYLTIRDNALLC